MSRTFHIVDDSTGPNRCIQAKVIWLAFAASKPSGTTTTPPTIKPGSTVTILTGNSSILTLKLYPLMGLTGDLTSRSCNREKLLKFILPLPSREEVGHNSGYNLITVWTPINTRSRNVCSATRQCVQKTLKCLPLVQVDCIIFLSPCWPLCSSVAEIFKMDNLL